MSDILVSLSYKSKTIGAFSGGDMKGTELILKQDGSLYHLNLKSGEISDLIITVGDPDRVKSVSRYFDEVEVERSCREFLTHTGRIGGRRITVISTGIGTDNVDIVLNELHYIHEQSIGKYYDAEQLTIIRLGTSGTIQPDVSIDSLLMTELALGMDNLLHFYRWGQMENEICKLLESDKRWTMLPRPYAVRADLDLLNHFGNIVDSRGITVTAPGFYAPQGRSVNLETRIPDLIGLLAKSLFEERKITNLEMETSGIYGLASLLGHRALSLSAILANRNTGEFSTDPDTAVDKMIRAALEVAVEL